jgi:hypothetical protein
MQQDVLTQLTDAIRTFNVRADRAGRELRIEGRIASASRSAGVFHVDILRSMPVGVDIKPEMRGEQCAAEIALFSAAEEINRLAEQAQRQHVEIEVRVATDAMTHRRKLELVLSQAL